jgi:Fic family protein
MNKDKFNKLRNKILEPQTNRGHEIIRASIAVLQQEIDDLKRIQSLLKAIISEGNSTVTKSRQHRSEQVLQFLQNNPNKTAPDIARAIGSNQSSAHSMMATLEKNKRVTRSKRPDRTVIWNLV